MTLKYLQNVYVFIITLNNFLNYIIVNLFLELKDLFVLLNPQFSFNFPFNYEVFLLLFMYFYFFIVKIISFSFKLLVMLV